MTQNSSKSLTSKSGFTIVELLIVIVVIAILATISVVAYNGIQARARASEVSSGLAQVKQKLELYRVDNSGYPLNGSLSSAGVDNKDVSYQYTSDGNTYCVTGTAGIIAYKVSSSSIPKEGVCNGHTIPAGWQGQNSYEIGDTGPAGGTVFYDAGSTQSWGRYLEAAPAQWNDGVRVMAPWGCSGSALTGADGTAIGTGKQNTADILAGCVEGGIAARVATAYTGGGKSDWFLPSADEAATLFTQRAAVGIIVAGPSNHWSSSEHSTDPTIALSYRFIAGGTPTAYGKTTSNYVWPIRAF